MAKSLRINKSNREEEMKAVLEKLRANPRVIKIRVATPQDCILGQTLQGVYELDQVPQLPAEGCSRPGGCICFYEPILAEIFP